MNRGVKMFGKNGFNTILKKLKQFNDREVVKPLKKHQITKEVRDKALGYLMFLKEKRTDQIKDRGCADGRPRRLYKSKYEISSPTVATDSLFILCVNDTREGRDVGNVDIPRAFLQTNISDGTIIKLQSVLVENLVRIDPKWKQ